MMVGLVGPSRIVWSQIKDYRGTIMQYLIVAFDGRDGGAKQRRLMVRADHIALGDEMVRSDEKLYGVAILNEAGEMIGSVAVVDFPSRDDLESYLAREPYVTGKVWESIEIRPCSRRPAPLPPFRPSDTPPEARVQTLVIGLDGTDDGARQRRLNARPAHIALGDEMISRSEMLYGVAILNDSGEMAGSMLILDFPSQGDLDAWRAKEPYITGKVWESVDVRPCRVGPSQQGLHRSTGELLVR
jgi:uncharacterized protein YciI